MATNGIHDVQHQKRAIRIAGASGGVFDRFRSIQDFAKDPTIDVIFGDWISEISMTFRGTQRAERNADEEALAFEMSFIAALAPAIKDVAKNKQKVAVNAGSCDPEAMAKRVKLLCDEHGLNLKIAWIEGDIVTDQVKEMISKGETFSSLPSDRFIQDWGFEPIAAQAYLGGMGIAEALKNGADIVVCGRVADASPVIGAAAWWHGWHREDFGKLANALIAVVCLLNTFTHYGLVRNVVATSHLVISGALMTDNEEPRDILLNAARMYVTGGYYTGFKKELLEVNDYADLGFPIAEIESDGGVVITKEAGSGGILTVNTCTAQLLYEIQGPLYYNSDVTARIDQIKFTQESSDRVRVLGVEGLPPPPTTKVGITARGGWQAEFHFFLSGLDIKEKAEMIEKQTRASMGEYQKEFQTLKFTVTGSVPTNPRTLDEATVDLRIFAQSRNAEIMSAGKHKGVAPDTPSFAKWCIENCLQGYPGGTPAMDLRQAVGKPYFEYWVALFPQERIKHQVRFLDGATLDIDPPSRTQTYPRQQESYDAPNFSLDAWEEAVEAPLGYIVHGRSGDKSSDCNVGFFVRHDDEYDWLRSTLSISKMKELLADEYKGGKIDRFELPHLNAVHFLLRDHLDRGANSSSSYNILGKQECEYLRSKLVHIPKRFLDRGRI